MFSMGRFDPRMEASPSQVETKTKKRKIHHDTVNNKEEEDDDDDQSLHSSSSSSAPSSDSENDSISSGHSSSSAPSSDSESDTEIDPALKVIAPEQKYQGVGDTPRKRRDMTDEGIDDFDNEEQNIDYLSEEIKTAMKLVKLPITEAGKKWKLAPFLLDNLQQDEYTNFFPIQALTIPDIIASERHHHIRNRDICVSAPTGSGKTLSFVLPVLNSLYTRRVRRLRALVVLPSRDLAQQVYTVFERYAQGSDLRIGLAIGQSDFVKEQCDLILGQESLGESRQARLFRSALDPFNLQKTLSAFNGIHGHSPHSSQSFASRIAVNGNLKNVDGLCEMPNGGTSAVDVLVCTPGRLMAHLESTPGFTLQHLRFLVIDEADRLMNQSYQNWIHRVVKAASIGPEILMANKKKTDEEDEEETANLHHLDPVTWRKEQDISKEDSGIDYSVCRSVQLRKLLFSATMTKDPRKLASLGLVNPKHFDAHHLRQSSEKSGDSNSKSKVQASYSLPETLSESYVECTAEQKPLVLLALLREQEQLDHREKRQGIVVIFTSSIDSTHRLARLLQLLYSSTGYGTASNVAEFSSALTQKQRAALMLRCNKESGDESSLVRVIVCSDGMSRGMDIKHVTSVVNYDVPPYAKTYVHRCGRTARAGKSGRGITIMKAGQVGKFKKMRGLIENPGNVTKAGIKKNLVMDALPVYKKCVRTLRKVLDAEDNEELGVVDELTSEWLN